MGFAYRASRISSTAAFRLSAVRSNVLHSDRAAEYARFNCDQPSLLRFALKRGDIRLTGVEVGFNGELGLVIGVARKRNAEELQQHAAHIVVNDLGELAD